MEDLSIWLCLLLHPYPCYTSWPRHPRGWRNILASALADFLPSHYHPSCASHHPLPWTHSKSSPFQELYHLPNFTLWIPPSASTATILWSPKCIDSFVTPSWSLYFTPMIVALPSCSCLGSMISLQPILFLCQITIMIELNCRSSLSIFKQLNIVWDNPKTLMSGRARTRLRQVRCLGHDCESECPP